MISLDFIKSKWHYLIFIAIFTHIIINWSPKLKSDNIDVISAIKRAQTSTCKIELQEIANYLERNRGSQKTLKRLCSLDLKSKARINKFGCITKNNNDIIKLDHHLEDSSECHNLCFSYGHSYGGFDDELKFCYCGDKETNFKVDTECDGNDHLKWYRVNEGIHYVNQTHLEGDPGDQLNSVKIAFLLVLSGHNSPQVKRLIRNIYSESHIFYLHVDERYDKLLYELQHDLKEYKNVIFAPSRYRTIWGGTSLLPMTIDAISQLARYNWDFLINLSESDFPIKPLKVLESYLRSYSKSSIYLKSHNIKGYKFIKKQGLDRNFYQCEDRVWKIGRRKLPLGVVYSGGSDWFALPRSFCFYILDNLNKPSSLVESLVRVYNFTLLPAESFFHTLAHNSEYCDRVVDNNLRVTNWIRKQGCNCQHKDIVDWCGCSPRVYRLSDWSRLLKTNFSSSLFFTRKFDPTISSSIINLVERRLVQDSSEIYNDTRYWRNLYKFDSEVHRSLEVSKQFGMFCLNQTEFSAHPKLSLESIDLFFNQDVFVGYILYYCSNLHECIRLLVTKNTESLLNDNGEDRCSELDKRSLSVLEVSHGFDIGERMFRDYRPLNYLSDVVVYHEWLSDSEKTTQIEHRNNRFIFSWINPQGHVRLSQSVKFKKVSGPTRVSLAHRLNATKPLEAGVWSLVITRHRLECFRYSFILFDSDSFTQKKIIQSDFDKFYSVSGICKERETDKYWSKLSLCSHQDWIPSN